MWKKVTIVFLSALLFGLTIFAVLRLAEKSEGIYSALNREIVQSELEGRKTAVVFFQIASGQTEELKNFESILQQYTQHLANLNDVLRQSQTAVLMACKSYADKAGDLRKKFSAWYAVSSSLNADNETLASIRSDFDQCERLYNVAIEQIQNAELQNDKLDAVVSASIIVITWLLGLFVAVILTRAAVQSAMQRKYFVARQKGAAVLKIHAGQKQPLRAVGKVPAGTFGSNATGGSSVYSSSSGLATAGSSVADAKHGAGTFGSNATSSSSVYSSSSGLASAGSSVAETKHRAGTFGSNATSGSSVYSSSSGLATAGSSVADAKHRAATFGSNATSSSSVYSSRSGLATAGSSVADATNRAGTFGSNAAVSSSVYSSSSGLATAGSSVADATNRAATFGSNAAGGSSVYSSSSGLATAGSSVADATNGAATFGSNAAVGSSVYSSSSGLATAGSSVAETKHGAGTFGSNAAGGSSVYSASSVLATASENMQLKAENRNLQQQAEKITTELKTVQAAYSNLLQTNEELKKAHELLQTETQHKLSVSSDKLSEKTDEAKNLITSFTESKNALASTQARISYTEKNITSISEIATMIEDIAEQIKMLSMNAAIEAAHAGESGKGFAVVATEMSKLATATSENSKNISTTVKELIKDITFIARAGGDLEKAFEKLDATTNSVHRFLVDVKKELI